MPHPDSAPPKAKIIARLKTCSSQTTFHSPDRRAEGPASHLAPFRGVVQVDGYPGFERLTRSGDIGLAACWAIVASLVATARLNEVQPFAYLKNVLERMSNGHR